MLLLYLSLFSVTLDETDDLTNNTRYFLAVVGRMYNMNLKSMKTERAFDLILNAMLDCNATLNKAYNHSIHRLKRGLHNMSDVTAHNESHRLDSPYVIDYAEDDSHSIQEIIAHAFHLSSMAILAIILLEVSSYVACALRQLYVDLFYRRC